MESLIDFVPKIEWGQMVLWAGMLSITLGGSYFMNLIARGITSLIMPVAKLGGQGDGDRLRVGGGKIGFDIEKSTLTDAIRNILMIAFFLVVLKETGVRFPNRIRLW